MPHLYVTFLLLEFFYNFCLIWYFSDVIFIPHLYYAIRIVRRNHLKKVEFILLGKSVCNFESSKRFQRINCSLRLLRWIEIFAALRNFFLKRGGEIFNLKVGEEVKSIAIIGFLGAVFPVLFFFPNVWNVDSWFNFLVCLYV